MAGAFRLELDTPIVALHRAQIKGTMTNSERPILGPDVDEEIEIAFYEIDQSIWPELAAMQVSTSVLLTISEPPQPSPPKQPRKLSNILRRYARLLFQQESGRYPPNDPQLQVWLPNLAERIGKRIVDKVRELENIGFRMRSVAYHGVSETQMLQIVSETLGQDISGWKTHPGVINGRPITKNVEPPNAPKAAPRKLAAPSSDPEIERRGALLAEYKAATGVSDYRIYNAKNSGIHKPQFYQWKNGVLPRGSKTAVHFEQFLREKRPPTSKN